LPPSINPQIDQPRPADFVSRHSLCGAPQDQYQIMCKGYIYYCDRYSQMHFKRDKGGPDSHTLERLPKADYCMMINSPSGCCRPYLAPAENMRLSDTIAKLIKSRGTARIRGDARERNYPVL